MISHKNRTHNIKNQVSLSFDGVNEYITMGNIAAMDFESNEVFSLSCWIKYTGNLNHAYMSKEIRSGNFQGWNLRTGYGGSPGGDIDFEMLNDTSTNRLVVRTPTGIANDGKWHHIVMTKNNTRVASGVKIYFDGVSQTLTTINNALSATSIKSTAAFCLGAADGAALFYNGSLDEASGWNIELTAVQVLEIYNGGSRINLMAHSKAANLVGYWRLGDPGATFSTNWSIPDDSVNNNTGTSVNMEAADLVEGYHGIA